MTKTKVITDSAAADFLTSPNTRFLLWPFMRGETTMGEAASVMAMELNTLHRRVQQMVALNLVEVTREEVRGGHRVKLYRTTSQEFIVPVEATKSVDLETHLDDGFKGSVAILSRGVAKAMERSAPRWGFRIYLSGNQSVFQQATGLAENGSPLPTEQVEKRSWYGDCGVRLDPEAARNFRLELQKLYENYLRQAKDEGEGEWHFFFAGFTPT